MTKVKDLSLESFLQHRVWCWDDDEMHHIPVPLHEHASLPDDLGTLFIRAKCVVGSVHQLNGYIIGLRSLFGLAIFVGDREFIFNLNLPEFANEDSLEVSKLLGIKGADVFPICYETGLHFRGGDNLAGEFSFS